MIVNAVGRLEGPREEFVCWWGVESGSFLVDVRQALKGWDKSTALCLFVIIQL